MGPEDSNCVQNSSMSTELLGTWSIYKLSKLDQPHQNKKSPFSSTPFRPEQICSTGKSHIVQLGSLMMQFRRLQKTRTKWMLSAKKSIYKVDVVFFWNRPKYNHFIRCNKLRSNACIIGCIKLKILISYLKVWESACPLFARKKIHALKCISTFRAHKVTAFF